MLCCSVATAASRGPHSAPAEAPMSVVSSVAHCCNLPASTTCQQRCDHRQGSSLAGCRAPASYPSREGSRCCRPLASITGLAAEAAPPQLAPHIATATPHRHLGGSAKLLASTALLLSNAASAAKLLLPSHACCCQPVRLEHHYMQAQKSPYLFLL